MLRRFPRIAPLIALILAAGAAGAWAADPRPLVGDVERLQAEATASYAAEKRQLALDVAVFFQDLVETGGEARLAISLEDGTMLTLGENASLRIDEFVYQPESGTGRLDLSVLEGAFLFVGGDTESMENTRVNIHTAVGTLGVRGTTVWGGVIDGSFGVLVTQGEVTVRNAAGEVQLSAGEGVQIESMDTPPSTPKKWPREKVQRALNAISFTER